MLRTDSMEENHQMKDDHHSQQFLRGAFTVVGLFFVSCSAVAWLSTERLQVLRTIPMKSSKRLKSCRLLAPTWRSQTNRIGRAQHAHAKRTGISRGYAPTKESECSPINHASPHVPIAKAATRGS